MPNWVFNSVVISGNKESLDKLQAQLNKPVTKNYPESNFNQETKQWEHTPSTQHYSNPVFSFWNVVAPTDLEAYYGEEKEKVELENFLEDFNNAVSNGVSWYYWNLRNWGTKWDIAAKDGSEYDTTRLEITDEGDLMYHFETAWSPVPEIFTILSNQYPDLTFQYEYEEEQGWGGNITWVNGEVTDENEYDIPESHEDFQNLEHRECYCEFDDSDSWFEDCPVDTEMYEWNGRNWVEKEMV